MCINLSDITNIKKEVLTNFDTHQPKKLRKTLALFMRDSLVSDEEKLDMLGELTIKDSEYFMETVYPSFPSLYGKTTIPELIETDEYMLKKYCFPEGEDIKTTFVGNVMDKKTTTSGRIYLTNYRIIVCGFQMTRSAQKKVQVGGPSLTGMLVRSGITRHRKAIRKAITKAFHKDLTGMNLGEWGYYFPIHNAFNSIRSKKKVSYAIKVETEKKTMTLRIHVTPTRVKKQPKDEFQEQKEYALNQVEDLLKQYQ